jgi:hypothetical protein
MRCGMWKLLCADAKRLVEIAGLGGGKMFHVELGADAR